MGKVSKEEVYQQIRKMQREQGIDEDYPTGEIAVCPVCGQGRPDEAERIEKYGECSDCEMAWECCNH